MWPIRDEEIAVAMDKAWRLGKKTSTRTLGISEIRAAIQGGVDSVEHGLYLDPAKADMMVEEGFFLVPTLAEVRNLATRGQ